MIQMTDLVEAGQALQPVEAVIISGPRKGEIVSWPGKEADSVPDAEIEFLNKALEEVIVKIDYLNAKVRAKTEAWQKKIEEM